MSWGQAKWTVDQIVARIPSLTGAQPNNMVSFTASTVNATTIGLRFQEPSDSVDSNGNILCAIGGVMIRMSDTAYPKNIEDGTLVIDNTELGKYKDTAYEVTGLTKDKEYYFSAFPYSTSGVYNLSSNSANRATATPMDGEAVNVSIAIDDASGFGGIVARCVDETDGTLTQSVTLTSGSKTASFGVPIGHTYHVEFGACDAYTQTVTKTDSKVSEAGVTSEYSSSYHYWTATINATYPTDGSTLVCECAGTSYTAAGTTGTYAFKVHKAGNWTLTLSDGTKTATRAVEITTDGDSRDVSIAYFTATIAVTFPEGSTCTLTGGNESQTSDTSGSYTFTVGAAGTYTISCTNGTDSTSGSVEITADGDAKTLELSYLKIVAWATGTDDEISKMIAAADTGKIKLSDYWTVGQERKVHLSAMAQADGVGESHVAQDVTMVLMNAGGKTDINGKEVNFIVGQKNGLASGTSGEYGYMESSNTNANGWDGCARRKWCNNTYYNALPATLKGIFKKFRNVTASSGNVATKKTSEDYFALPSEMEVFGATTYANATAENENKQFTYYATAANRVKKCGDTGSAAIWWERSPCGGDTTYFCFVGSGGTANNSNASGTRLLAPFGCI